MAFVQQLPKAVFIHMQKYCTNIIISFLVPIKQSSTTKDSWNTSKLLEHILNLTLSDSLGGASSCIQTQNTQINIQDRAKSSWEVYTTVL